MNNQPSLPAEHNDHSQIRNWTRFPPDSPGMWVIVGDEQKGATLFDESFGGIGIVIEIADAVNVQVGDPLIVFHYDYPTPGRVQWIQRNPETQQARLGIRFEATGT
jgi:hypothetical protein